MVSPAGELSEGRPVVVLIGPPGSGKSSVGARVARALGCAFTDTDAVVEARAGAAISDIFLEHGEAHFRQLEQQAVAEALENDRGVVSLGGGAVMTPETEQALAGHTVVFLDVSIADAARRVGFDQSRPLLAVNPRAAWTRLMNGRRPTYERIATHRVDTAGRKPAAIADEILSLLGQAPQQADHG